MWLITLKGLAFRGDQRWDRANKLVQDRNEGQQHIAQHKERYNKQCEGDGPNRICFCKVILIRHVLCPLREIGKCRGNGQERNDALC